VMCRATCWRRPAAPLRHLSVLITERAQGIDAVQGRGEGCGTALRPAEGLEAVS
jgi:hypothetical protein